MSAAPPDAIQRTLFSAAKVHIYAVPPLVTNKGYAASQWTQNDPIFTARIRIAETALSNQPSRQRPAPPAPVRAPPAAPARDAITVDIILEDPSSSELFAAAPYTHPSVVSACTDSTRFFALRVVGDGGRKATLGVGFEERGEAFDFGIALEDARKVLGFAAGAGGAGPGAAGAKATGVGAPGNGAGAGVQRDFSLKEGEMIKVDVGKRATAGTKAVGGEGLSGFSAGGQLLPPPPPPPPSSASEMKKKKATGEGGGAGQGSGPTAEELGFDDGEFGEFQ